MENKISDIQYAAVLKAITEELEGYDDKKLSRLALAESADGQDGRNALTRAVLKALAI